jgi:hypothetical protein
MKLLAGIVLIVLVGLPILAGCAKIPSDLSPASLGEFAGDVVGFWLNLLKQALMEIGQILV